MPEVGAAGEAEVLEILRGVKDPEVPVLDIVELGIVRGAEVDGSKVTVRITPTYSGCPALHVIEQEIVAALRQHRFTDVSLKTVFNPPWTTDWMSSAAKEKLRAYGIAPPGRVEAQELVTLGRVPRAVACPYCGGTNTSVESEFGSTSCKSIHYCHSCHQPFEQFKAI
ncbi:MAG: 1,2-phenylacetyl-CoA epoxidase subunit PaaD [Gemmatimonadota bacterium]